jgi:hypothetical protein
MPAPTEPGLWWRTDGEKRLVADVRQVNGHLLHGEHIPVEDDGSWLRKLDHGEAFVTHHACELHGRGCDGYEYVGQWCG